VYSIDLATGERSLVIENPGFAGFLIDERYAVRFAFRNLPDGSSQLIAPDDANARRARGSHRWRDRCG
jgi:hypothetical protein